MPPKARGLDLTPEAVSALATDTLALSQAIRAMHTYAAGGTSTADSFGRLGKDIVGGVYVAKRQELIDAVNKVGGVVDGMAEALKQTVRTFQGAEQKSTDGVNRARGN